MNRIIVILMVLLNLKAGGQSRFSRVAIRVTPSEVKNLLAAGLDFDHGEFNKSKNIYTTVLSEHDLIQLRKTSYNFEVLVEDETRLFLEKNNNENFYQSISNNQLTPNEGSSCTSIKNLIDVPLDFTEGSMGGYYTLEEIYTKVDQMISKYPGLVAKDTIGYSYEGRPLVIVKISDNVLVDENEPEVFEHTLQHAREPMGMMHLMFFMQYILQHYDTDAFCREIIDSRELFYLLCMNPDGYEFNRLNSPNGGGFHRKNRNPENGTAEPLGTDLNRNYSVDWGFDNIGSSPNPSSETYRGPRAFSEPETQAVRKFVNSRQLSIHIDNHTFGNLFIYPYGVPGNHVPQPQDEVAFYEYSKYLLPRYNFFVTGLATETVGYEVNGVSTDWYVAGDLDKRGKVFSYASEAGRSTDGFWPLKSRIIPLAKEQFWHHFQIAYMAGSQVVIQDESPSSIIDDDFSLQCALTQTGIKGKSVEITLVPVKNLNSNSQTQVALLNAFLEKKTFNFQASALPGLPAGSEIKYIWDCFTDGVHYYDTVVRIYKGTLLFVDDMEDSFSTNWTTNKDWNFTSSVAYGGSKSLHDAIGSNYNNSVNNIVTCKSVFDLSQPGQNTYMHFYTRFKAENGYDKMTLEISTNGLSGPFTPVCGQNTIKEDFGELKSLPSYTGVRNSWVRETIDLSTFTGQSSVSFRFRMTSDAAVADEGFYIDDLSVVRVSAGGVLPLQIHSFTAAAASGSVLLNWNGYTTNAFQLFEVQHSSDGQNFKTVDKIYNKSGPWYYTHKEPVVGSNFYRIKEVMSDGMALYSEIRKVPLSEVIQLHISPNPVKDFLRVVYQANNAPFKIVSASGQEVIDGTLVNGLNTVNVQQLPRGFYSFIVVSTDGVQQVKRFIKN